MSIFGKQFSGLFGSVKMFSPIYKTFFVIYTILGVLCLKFDGSRFRISKFHVYRNLLFLSLFLIFYLIKEDLTVLTNSYIPDMKQTKFSKSFFNSTAWSPLIQICLIVVTQIYVSKHVAKCFYIFKNFESFFKREKIEMKKLKIQLLFQFSLFVVAIIYNISVQGSLLIRNWEEFKFFIFFMGFLSILVITSTLAFTNAMMLVFNFTLNSYVEIVEKEIQKDIHDHEKIELLLIGYNGIFKLLKHFQKSISKLTSLALCSILLTSIFIVSMKIQYRLQFN